MSLSPPATKQALLAFCCLAFANSPAAAQAPQRSATDHRWLVELDTSRADLDALRDAIVIHPNPDRARALIARFERSIPSSRAAFIDACRAAGGTIERHWWLVTACLVRGPAGFDSELAELPNVVRVERDDYARGTDNRPLDEFNHGDAFLHTIGFDGSGLSSNPVIAVVDSGIDIDTSGLGRPHRAFFANGNPADLSGGGLAGSRIVHSVQIGSLSEDDQHGHGTSSAAVAAGYAWGTPGSVDGHARAAKIANYGIGDGIGADGSIFALYSSMTSAWQQIVVDRVALEIVVANLSFEGQQDPMAIAQQALDTAARVADVLIVASAGNGGPAPSTGGQSCANGIAVAAVTPDAHQIEDYSARGPAVGDPLRTYPDLAAIGRARVPVRDCETATGGDWYAGTSAAAPRVAGSALIVRAAAPHLRADETKAILLASAIDLTRRVPGASHNTYGVGLLRTDRAVTTAVDSTRHARNQISVSGAQMPLGLPVDPGTPTAIAIAWLRDPSDAAWSDLDLVVRDPANGTVLATSRSPRNLYEVARFVAPGSGFVLAEITANSLQNGQPQEFGLAIATLSDAPTATSPRGQFRPLDDGCPGPTPGVNPGVDPGVDPLCLAFNDPTNPIQLNGSSPFAERYENAIEVTAPSGGMQVTGFELFARGDAATTLSTSLFLAGAVSGLPATAPVRTSTMRISDAARWYRTEFSSPLTVSSGARVYLGVSGWRETLLTLAGGPDVLTIASRDACASVGGGGWNGTFQDAVGVRVLCAGTPRADNPRNTTTGAVRVGESCAFELERVGPNTLATLLLGFSRTFSPTLGALPFDLTLFGGAGCGIHVDPSIQIPVLTDAIGHAIVPASITANPNFVDFEFFTQFAVIDLAGPRWITTSNSANHRIGVR